MADGVDMANRKKLRSGPHKASDLFDLKRYPELSVVWGIYVGEGCVIGDEPLEWRTIEAHAHSTNDDEWQGWICIANAKDIITTTGRPTHTLIHELAHLVLRDRSHGKKWADTVIRLGASAEAKKYYKPRVKKEQTVVKDEGIDPGGIGAGDRQDPIAPSEELQ